MVRNRLVVLNRPKMHPFPGNYSRTRRKWQTPGPLSGRDRAGVENETFWVLYDLQALAMGTHCAEVRI
jgi:hypothetical protein